MINIDKTWELVNIDFFTYHNRPFMGKLTGEVYYRESPIQPQADKFTYYQFFDRKTLFLVESKVPTLTNRKELEKLALGYQWITRRKNLDDYLLNNPNALDIAKINMGLENIDLYSEYPSYMKHPDTGDFCYIRPMVTTDDLYRSGMSVLASITTEEIYVKNFDNVGFQASKKGYTSCNKEVITMIKRDFNLDKILD